MNTDDQDEATVPTELPSLSEEERARAMEWLAAHPYGEQDENGIDISLLRENLRLTPTERWDRLRREMRYFRNVRIARRSA